MSSERQLTTLKTKVKTGKLSESDKGDYLPYPRRNDVRDTIVKLALKALR